MASTANSRDTPLRLLFTHEQHAVRCGTAVFTKGLIGYSNLRNYLGHIKEGTVVLRTQSTSVSEPEPQWKRVDGNNIDVFSISEFGSMLSLLRNFPGIHKHLKQAVASTNRYLVRLPGPCGTAVAFSLLLRGKRFAVEFVGHPTDTIALQLASQGRKRPMMLWLLQQTTHFLIRRAIAVSYVSAHLYETFPHRNPDRVCIFSDVHLPPQLVTAPRPASDFDASPFRILTVGRLGPEKGHAILLEAYARLKARVRHPMMLQIVGDGPCLADLKAQADRLRISSECEFSGRLEWGKPLFDCLDCAHVFVLPSFTEGMPRALIEAMARGLPAAGSRCGGITELLAESVLAEPGNAEALANVIEPLVGNQSRLAEHSKRNFETSLRFHPSNLKKERGRFWNLVITHAK